MTVTDWIVFIKEWKVWNNINEITSEVLILQSPSFSQQRNDSNTSSALDLWLASGKKRKPAWTDRILWRVRPKSSTDDDESSSTASWVVDDDEEYPLKVAQDVYTSNMEYGVSDHKPVVGVFSLEV